MPPKTQRTRAPHTLLLHIPVSSRHVRTYNKYATIVHGLFSISLSLLRRIKYNDHDYYSSWILVFSPFFKRTSYFFFLSTFSLLRGLSREYNTHTHTCVCRHNQTGSTLRRRRCMRSRRHGTGYMLYILYAFPPAYRVNNDVSCPVSESLEGVDHKYRYANGENPGKFVDRFNGR